ncbi:amidase family protein [Amycolatopsis sp.]|uniref:amidase family protein n=1 Tax=Amycolatopsis sp. TaxID=37632 RepID=UPI002BEEEFED|nr:amidase family protein [Amycolatopsis sp.]HVV08294.1 amidase family protein [Amycolatopsis sp.]
MTAVTSSLAAVDGTRLLADLASGAVTAVELLERHLALLDGPGAALGAVVDTDREGARAAAEAVDAGRAAGHAPGPLAGLPVTIKDAFDAKGMRTSHGRLSDAHRATGDAPLVRRLREAGAIVVGKTNVPVHLADHQSANADFGRTRNPFAPGRSPGGSSGGAAAAVAAGLAVADFGSDLAGSLRVPAAWCGLFGHRPSNGIVSKLGHLPWPAGGLLEPRVSAVGPMTRSAADSARFLDVIAGAEGLDAFAWRLELPPARVDALAGTRVAVWPDDPACLADNETRAAIRAFADALDRAGAHVEELADPPVRGEGAIELFVRLQAGEVVHGLDDEAYARSAGLVDAPGRAGAMARGHVRSLRAALDDFEAQRHIAARWAEVHERYHVVLCPAAPCAAPPHSDVPNETRLLTLDGTGVPAADAVAAWSRISSLGGGPATVVPLGAGAVSGLPVGAQLLGRYLDDRTPLRVAALAEEAGLVGFTTPEGW